MPSLRDSKASHHGTHASFGATKALAGRKGLLVLGDTPAKVVRNQKVEATWLSLLSDPPVSYGDSNNWRQAADVRPSSFPFCPRRYALERLGVVVTSTFTVEANYYTEGGKAAHYVVQNALARTGRLWGFWTCARPSCKQRFDDEPDFYPEEQCCPRCGNNLFEYEELTLEDPCIKLRGHCDGVLVFKKHSALLEIKTTSDEKVTKLRNMSDEQMALMFQTEAPYFGYHHQAAGCYASLVREAFPQLPPLRETIYLFLSRDSPKNVVSWSMPVPEDDSWWKDIRARIVMGQVALAEHVLPFGFAEDRSDLAVMPSCKWCPVKDVCMSPEGHVRYAADALYDKAERRRLQAILNQERDMGSIIRGDVVETTEVLVPEPQPAPPPKPEPEVVDEDEDEKKKKA